MCWTFHTTNDQSVRPLVQLILMPYKSNGTVLT